MQHANIGFLHLVKLYFFAFADSSHLKWQQEFQSRESFYINYSEIFYVTPSALRDSLPHILVFGSSVSNVNSTVLQPVTGSLPQGKSPLLLSTQTEGSLELHPPCEEICCSRTEPHITCISNNIRNIRRTTGNITRNS